MLRVKSERGEFPMKSLLMPGTALTTLRNFAFTLLCCTVLMVVAVSAQTNPSNLGPPAGPILDLGGAYATPPTAALLVPGGGLNTYQQYTVNFTGTGNPTA